MNITVCLFGDTTHKKSSRIAQNLGLGRLGYRDSTVQGMQRGQNDHFLPILHNEKWHITKLHV